MTLYSHIFPDGRKLELREHLHTVGKICAAIVQSKTLNFEIRQEIIQDIAYIIGVTHDFGKATHFFQEERLNLQKKGIETNHSKLSALFGYAVISRYVQSNSYNLSESWKRFLRLAVFYIIDRHHSNLCDIEDTKDFPQIIDKQIENLRPEVWEYKFQAGNFSVSFKDFRGELTNSKNRIVQDFLEDEERISQQNIDQRMEQVLLLLFLFSILMEADKARLILSEKEYDASGPAIEIPTAMVDEYKIQRWGERQKDQIELFRESAYQHVIQKLADWNFNQNLYSINLPTGMGKTLLSFSLAIKLRKRLKAQRGIDAKIIYAFPFLSIIEQTDEVFREVMGSVLRKYGDQALLKHHSLSERTYKRTNITQSLDGDDIEQADFLINIWESATIITTFDQVLYSMLSKERSFLMRFHNLFNAILIFDEVQTIPHKMWFLLNKVFTVLAHVGKTCLLFMTATKPLIFDKDEMKELIDDVTAFFQGIDRVRLFPRVDSPISFAEFRNIVLNAVEHNPKKNILIVMNTVQSSIEMYEALDKYLKEKSLRRKLFYLSTNIVPRDRNNRIERVRKSSKKGLVMVSTQCVEAGVDIDMDIIFRDFAPLDAIIQICGRANRHGKRSHGEVFIYKVSDDSTGRSFASYIYDPLLLHITEEILKGKKEISEQNFISLNDEYFTKLNIRKVDNESKALLKSLCELQFSKLDIPRILRGEEIYNKIDLFVKRDSKAEKVLHRYKDALSEKDWRERKRKLLMLRKDIFENTISVQTLVRRKGQVFKIEDVTNEIANGKVLYIDKRFYKEDIGFDPTSVPGTMIV